MATSQPSAHPPNPTEALTPQQLSGKQREFLRLLRESDARSGGSPGSLPMIPSLRAFCQAEGIDFNFAKGFLLSGLLDGVVQTVALERSQWQMSAKGDRLGGIVPGVLLLRLLVQGQTQLTALQAQLQERLAQEVGSLRAEGAIALEGNRIQLERPELLEVFEQRQRSMTAIATYAAPDPNPDPLDPDPLDPDPLDPDPLNPETITWLHQQGLITEQHTSDYHLTPLPALYSLDLSPTVTSLTTDLLLSGQWASVEFKPYNIHTDVPDIRYGKPSILSQCIGRIRAIFLTMGFDEMSGSIVESAFWNFDALFTPQDHPAREIQDTFYLDSPRTLPLPEDTDLIQAVQEVHTRSYGGSWTPEEASRAILRAHTTTSTARKLYDLQGKPGKYFSIDRVFRNETIDRTHLAEFHQIEGVVIGDLLSVRSLMGYLSYFYQQLGFEDLKFKPTYNPYTEPSLEVFAYHQPSQRYLEVGNSGLFRPEMLEPLGCKGKLTVAWGLGLERIAMLLYGVDALMDLVGPEIRLY